MNYEIVEFIVNNREQINAHITAELASALVASRIFDNNPQIKEQFLDHRKEVILRNFIADHFPHLPPGTLLFDDELLEHLKEK